MYYLRQIIFFIFTIQSIISYAQENSIITGTITDEQQKPVPFANIQVQGTKYGTSTDDQGNFEITFPYQSELNIAITCINYYAENFIIKPKPGEKITMNRTLRVNIQKIDTVMIISRYDPTGNMQKIDVRMMDMQPNITGGVENLLKTLPGVSSNNELSSQYNVRGGNFDENIIYINDVEIYRPFLIREGQQEGMSFVNPDLVSSLKFSAGGYDASYGDRMSSVLDITYKKPTCFSGSVSGSFLGGSVHLEGTINKKLSYLIGARYKTTQYLLGTLDTKGQYNPDFSDIQAALTYTVNDKLDIGFLGAFSQNIYNFIPVSQTTIFGNTFNSYQLNVYYNGNEEDRYTIALGALSINYKPSKDLSLKFIGSIYNSQEQETYDILGQYWINEVNITGNNTTDSIGNIAVGSFLNHARNYLSTNVISIAHKGSFNLNKNRFKWGLTFQWEYVHDQISEWDMIDSAGYSLPYSPNDNVINLFNHVNAGNLIRSTRTFGYIMYVREFKEEPGTFFFTAGLRANYWDFSHQLVFSPRTQLSFQPKRNNNFLLYAATGVYQQPPFYKEMVYPDGSINYNIKAQKSFHFVLGSEYTFRMFERPFKFTSEAYYKRYSDLIPYQINNLSIQYSAVNDAIGYATGIDFKLNGEFVKGIESWTSLSIMQTEEKQPGKYYYDSNGNKIEPGYYPRPTDQLVNFAIYFQDYLPMDPTYRANLTLFFGSPLPYNNPYSVAYNQVFRMPSYKRVDIGFTKVFKTAAQKFGDSNPFRFFSDIWLSLEVFNLLQIQNTVSYTWLQTVGNGQQSGGAYPVPNYLTSRRVDLKITLKF